MRQKKGFSLIEMLVVIAVIAVLIAIILPLVATLVKKAHAATDAANLRSITTEACIVLLGGGVGENVAEIKDGNVQSSTFPGAKIMIYYSNPADVFPYFVVGDNYYGIEYFSDVAKNGISTISTAKPAGDDDCWIAIGGTE